ncbi:MAG: RNHCP domain-containing protein [Planctomycetota bacterium]
MPSPNRRHEDGDFTCIHCKCHVEASSWGTRNRNHCPVCLWSRHVDDHIGDRASDCRAPMEPISVAAKADGEWVIVHRCTGCQQLRINRIAGDDAERALLALALRPLANPPFPLDSMS